MNNTPVYLFILGMIVCGGFTVLLFVGGAFLIFYLGKNVVAPMRQRQIQKMAEDWADEHGYEFVAMHDPESRDHPFADRCGVGRGKSPGIVKGVDMRDPKGRMRQGWIYVRVRLGPRGSTSLVPNSLEVAWED